MKTRAVFFDRDGTVIKIIHRPDHPKKFTAPFTMDELDYVSDVNKVFRELRRARILTIIVTNQPDYHKGHVDRKTWKEIHDEVLATVNPDDCFMCKHLAEWKCSCRKPLPGMLLAAAYLWDIDLSKSFMIGDTSNDMLAGKAAGCKTFLIRWPYNLDVEADYIMPDLITVAHTIKSELY